MTAIMITCDTHYRKAVEDPWKGSPVTVIQLFDGGLQGRRRPEVDCHGSEGLTPSR